MDSSLPPPPHPRGHADRAWYGYHPRALVPPALAAAAVVAGAWSVRWWPPDPAPLVALAPSTLMWASGLALGAVFLYRTVTYTYRLTDRALLVDFGPLARPTPAVPLAEVTDVRAGAGPFGRWLGVGWVEVRTAARAVRLTGVRHPGAFARLVRTAAGLPQ